MKKKMLQFVDLKQETPIKRSTSKRTGDFNETYGVPDYTYLKVTAKSKGGDGGEFIHGENQQQYGNNYYYTYMIELGGDETIEIHYYFLGGGGGGGADFEGEYYGNEINVQKNNDIITLNYNNKQIVITPGQDGSNNYIDTDQAITDYVTYQRSIKDPNAPSPPDGYIYGYDGEGGEEGIVNLPTNTDEWENISYVTGVSGESLGWFPSRFENLIAQTYSDRGVLNPYGTYTVPDVSNNYHLEGGSPLANNRGGRGVVANVVGEPNATLRYGGNAYLKLEWIEKPQN